MIFPIRKLSHREQTLLAFAVLLACILLMIEGSYLLSILALFPLCGAVLFLILGKPEYLGE